MHALHPPPRLATDSPEWRYLAALDMIDEDGRPSPKHDDYWTFEIHSALSKRNRRRTRAKQRRFQEEYGPVLHALAIYEAAAAERWHLEALVLADVPAEKIAEMHLLPELVVVYYERLFLDVRDCLRAEAYILSRVIEPHFLTTPPATVPAQMKIVAYYGGPGMLRGLLRHGKADPVMRRFLVNDILSQAAKGAFGATLAAGPDREEHRVHLRESLDRCEAWAETDEGRHCPMRYRKSFRPHYEGSPRSDRRVVLVERAIRRGIPLSQRLSLRCS